MTKKNKIFFTVVLMLFCFAVLQVSAMWTCDDQGANCVGECYCVGDVSSMGEDPCCFKCEHWSGDLECCIGIGPLDGCFTFEH